MSSPQDLQIALKNNSELINKAFTGMRINHLLNAYFANLDTLRLEKHISHDEKLASERAIYVETFDQIIELTGQGNEITKLIGEIAENAHTFLHMPEEVSKLLIHGGGVGALISGTIGFATIPLLCAVEKRKPKPTEIAIMGLSGITIILGSLIAASVGGPIGVGAFVLAISTIGLGRVALNYFQEWRERKLLKKEVKHLEKEIDELENNILKEIKNSLILRNKLLMIKNNSSKIKEIGTLQAELTKSSNYLESLIKELEIKSVVFAEKSSKLLKLEEKRTSRWEIARKGMYVGSGVLAIVGAILLLTPAAPIGGTLMLTASIITVTTLISSFIVNRIKNYQIQKSLTKAKHSLHELQEIDAKTEHNSDYLIDKSLTIKKTQPPKPKAVEKKTTPKVGKKDLKLKELKTSQVFIPPVTSQIKNTANKTLKSANSKDENKEGEGEGENEGVTVIETQRFEKK